MGRGWVGKGEGGILSMGTCKVTGGERSQDVTKNQSGQTGTRCVRWQVS